ncbi:ABC transporter ATP-binding protein [Cohnella hongkongensis]|uniref:ABC transporter ATP-binding protein n=1 Tax=Cohnella hongkongensis TaxID=178337 RepID=A0ABV9F4K5_9BACL
MSEQAAKLLEIRRLNVFFRNDDERVHAIKDVNLHVGRGELVTVVGESGSGKTVTVRSILGLLPAAQTIYDGGEIRFEGRNLLDNKPEDWSAIRGSQISMVFQDPMTALNPVFTVGTQLENVYVYQGMRRMFGLSQRDKRRRKQEARARALELLEKMKLPDPPALLNRYPFELSGGMRQRIVIALALMHTPRLLIADEPGTALDVTVQDSINKELKRLVRDENISMIYITHNLGVAREMGERTYVMQHGRVVEEGSTKDVFSAPRHDYTRSLLQAVPKLV